MFEDLRKLISFEFKRSVVVVYFILLNLVGADVSKQSFAETLKSDYFVDKTLFIRDFVNKEVTVSLVTAPPRSGKSTVLDMLRTFLSVGVDSNGEKTPPKTTDSYKLFCDNGLEICKNKTFVDNHLGQYPVIYIDFSPLSSIINDTTFVNQFESVIKNTYRQHKYLSGNFSLFPSSEGKVLFDKHCSEERIGSLNEVSLQNAFVWLCELLHRHFGSKPIVLLDNYDSYYGRYFFGKIHDLGIVISFLEGVVDSLFKYNSYLSKGLLTGVVRVRGLGSTFGEKLYYRWLGNHEYTKYYGLTEEEVLHLVRKHVTEESQQKVTQKQLEHYYGGYVIEKQPTKLYSLGSVVKFFQNKMKADSYLAERSYTDGVMNFVKTNDETLTAIKKLVLEGGSVFADITTPLSGESFIRIRQITNNEKHMTMESAIFILFDLGYLTTDDESEDAVFQFDTKIPNQEIKIELTKLLRNHL